MSEQHNNAAHDADHGHHDHAAHGSLKSYFTGFLLSVILTAIPFWLVIGKVFEKSSTTGLVVLGFAAVQIVVHMIYFLHMNTKSESGWSMLALIFTVMLVVIMLSGSIWVMYHLDHNMMPGMMPEAIGEIPHALDAMPAPMDPAMHALHGAHKMP
jgi:cytochrome o ubiquinol oxidase operon protein cyoD